MLLKQLNKKMSLLNKIFVSFFINLIKFYSFFSPFFIEACVDLIPVVVSILSKQYQNTAL